MKTASILFLLFLSCTISRGFDTSISFKKIKYSEIFAVAKKENKHVMLSFHFDGCGGCAEMRKNIFNDKKVYNYYNAHFVSYEINILDSDGKEINKTFGIQNCPAFVYLNQDGNEIHRIVGVFSADDFISEGQKAFDTLNSLSHLRRLYNNGNRDPEFVRKYCYTLDKAEELDSLTINNYVQAIDTRKNLKAQDIKFIYEFAYHNDQPTIVFNSIGYNLILNNRRLFNKYFDSTQVNARLVFLALAAAYESIDNGNEKKFDEIVRVLRKFDVGKIYNYREIDNRITAKTASKHLVLNLQLAYYEKNNDSLRYEATLNKLIHSIWTESDELNSLASDFYEKFDNEKHLLKALKWIKRSVELNNGYANNDTWAQILFKLGKRKEALERAHKAIEIAKKEGLDYSPTSQLIDRIKE